MIRVGAGDAELAAEIGVPHDLDADIVLERADGRLQLRDARENAPGPLYVDFNSTDIQRRLAAGKSLPLVRAVAGRGDAHGSSERLTVIDATAGLGRDAFTLSKAGLRVIAIERSPVVAALLRDGLQRANSDVEMHAGDAIEFMREHHADVVYLDPMFPERRKSALVKKEMQYFQALLGEDDAEGLFKAAKYCATKRVVIKRPTHAPELAKANHTIPGKTVRFDVYVV